MDCYTANWDPLGESAYYRKLELYSMSWNLKEDLRDYLVAAAPYGGPIALMKNKREKSPSSRPLLEIYSASGIQLASVVWKDSPAMFLGWTTNEDLLSLQENGIVLLHSLFGEFKKKVTMNNDVMQERVLEARVFYTTYGTGLALLSALQHRFSLANNIYNMKLRKLPVVPGLQGPPSCWTVLCQNRVTNVLLAVGQELYLLDDASCTPVTLPWLSPHAGSFLRMAVSFNHRFLALFTDTGYVWMGRSNLKEKLAEFTCDYRSCPKQMAWCTRQHSRQRAVVMAWDRCLVVAGSDQQSIQYKQLTKEVLLDRVVLRRLYPVAIKICEYLRLSEFQGISRILAHWACYKVQQRDKSDEELAQVINQKLGDAVGISYSDIATQAYESNRTELAIKLLEYEPRPGKQVPLLLTMKRSQLALSRAIESGDSDLVYTVISRLKDELGRGDFFMALQNQPVALSLYRQFCKHKEPNTLKDLYNQDDNHQELGNFHVRSSYISEKWIEGRVASLQNAVDEYYKAKNEFAAKATEDQIKLLRHQRRFQDDFDKPYVDLSLHDTVYNLILDGKHKLAEQLYRDFRIPDKRFWWLKISALAEQGAWEDLEKFSKSKKSPIGYLPFAEISMKYGNSSEAKKYTARVTPEQKVKAFLLVGDFSQAAEAATERKNEAEMNLILSKCTDATVAAKLEQAKSQLGKK
ncbi:vacuolar protein sorting-associated protein 16 homolog isoform X2 [Protobothrops mucrosquamatus]|uniref:vacuolar protein sorting-associated protein 16 homolog isoform X2 n=1 Tax=Protobothrops mucrosquamatus TaxID=103944 RepID=UPI000775DA43|nr:vacuolar protein sorting-associated protein 16 homolog isoform X2 [Protobothrops mucrosquamatus]